MVMNSAGHCTHTVSNVHISRVTLLTMDITAYCTLSTFTNPVAYIAYTLHVYTVHELTKLPVLYE